MKFLIFFLLFLNCSNSQKFKKLEEVNISKVNLYILRESNPLMAIYSYEIEIYNLYRGIKYKDHRKLERKVKLKTGEYIFLNLEEGLYSFKIIDKENTEKIIYLNKNKEYFLQLYIFSKDSGFTLPEFMIKEITKEESLEMLLDYTRMKKVDSISF
jgi:hypothetical protein